jgi:hypothetical protein
MILLSGSPITIWWRWIIEFVLTSHLLKGSFSTIKWSKVHSVSPTFALHFLKLLKWWTACLFVFKCFFVGLPHLATYIFLNFQIEPELAFDFGMAFTPFPLSIQADLVICDRCVPDKPRIWWIRIQRVQYKAKIWRYVLHLGQKVVSTYT